MKSLITAFRVLFAVTLLVSAMLSAAHFYAFIEGDEASSTHAAYTLLMSFLACYGYLFATERQWEFDQ